MATNSQVSLPARSIEPVTPQERKQYMREWLLERAALIEYEAPASAPVSRKDAEFMAVDQWHKMAATDPDLQISFNEVA